MVLENLQNNNPFRGRTEADIEKMRQSLMIEMLPNGLCLHHPMRGEPCAGDGVCLGCNNFITTIDFLPVHEARLENVENELSRMSNPSNVYGSKLSYQKGRLEEIISDLTEKQRKHELEQAAREVAVSKE
jgi:hypothetical protein